MLFAVSGSRLFIGGAVADPMPWVEILSAEGLGSLGVDAEAVEVTHGASPHVEIVKGALAPRAMQIVLANDVDDPGQLFLWRAARSRDAFRFRLEFPGGLSWRQWSALVMSLDETFDAANSLMKLLATLQLTSDIERPETS